MRSPRRTRALGCDVPFMRPAELARDETPHLPVMQHAVAWLREQELPARRRDDPAADSPLRRAEDIRAAVGCSTTSGADSVLTVSEVSTHVHPMRMLRVADDGTATLFVSGEPVRRRINRRQDLPAGVDHERVDLRFPHGSAFGCASRACTAIARSPCRATPVSASASTIPTTGTAAERALAAKRH